MIDIQKLHDIGAQKIFEQTHIAKKFVEDILNENFTTMNKIQFTGFISILEREYSVDLHALRDKYNEALNIATGVDNEPFVVSAQETPESSKNKPFYIIGAIVVVGIILTLMTSSDTSEKKDVPTEKVVVSETVVLESTTIEEAKANLNHLGNTTVSRVQKEEIPEVVVEPMHLGKFEVIPRSKLWIGIVDIETYVRTQKLGSVPFELASDKDWLLVMGHGYVNFEVNGEELKYKDENKVWFSYENGSLSKLTRSEFKEKNRGKAW